ncbi:hypothetical protein [Rhodanobacter spathiphylli]|uniref:Uncharacterized protein n=1 Tax=Rhodanobacter spathiphylli B39 TaxID=1163407 RepID=I4W346_9GAMM|nr:hypothetical protein [Rhodanobacter spathiphylli]EIL93887.1 hypothetical protein UU7_07173 [Rhodanobacter spathiphylli B39]
MSKSPSQQVPAVIAPGEPGRITAAILDFVSEVPDSRIDSSRDPANKARRLASRAAQRAALTAGSLALPPGPLGWLTLLPELIAIWKIQGQMVSDIAAAYGRHASLGREQMMWCLFRHTAAQAFRDLVVRMGDRLIFRRMSWGVAQRVAKQIGVKFTQRTLSKGVSRWLPVVGALGVGAYAYYDTGQVAATAIEMFESEVTIEEAADADAAATGKPRPAPKPKPKPAAKAARRVAGKLVDKAVATAARKVAGAAQKAAGKTRPKKPDPPQRG